MKWIYIFIVTALLAKILTNTKFFIKVQKMGVLNDKMCNDVKCITPFYFDKENPFLCVEKNIESIFYTNQLTDLTLYEKDSHSEEGRYEKYNLFLVNNVSEIV
jgi:hypothetical protein